MEELKPCPFCGGKALLMTSAVRGYTGAREFKVRCTQCMEVREKGTFDTIYQTEEAAKEKAIAAWNTRADSWHTGLPTEDGWYLCEYRQYEYRPYRTHLFKDGKWEYLKPEKFLRWKKLGDN